jgi:hypothetical protein
VLFEKRIIKRVAFDHYEWTKKKISLAEYFRWVGNNEKYVYGGFWDTVEKVFKVDRRTLSKLASRNECNGKESRDFKKTIKPLVLEYREWIEKTNSNK